MAYLFTSESVSEGHPDKVSDQISDALLDAFLAKDPKSRVAVETMCTTGLVVVAGEVTTEAYVDVQEVVRQTIHEIGYTDPALQFDAASCGVLTALHAQSPDIAQGVDEGAGVDKDQGAGDQGLMFGYASTETDQYMPLALAASHGIVRKLAEMRKTGGHMPYLRPDAKSQVTVEYDEDRRTIKRVHTIVVSTQHHPDATREQIEKDLRAYILPQVFEDLGAADKLDLDEVILHVNPTGRFVIGGPHGDTGLTGRKIIVDTYGTGAISDAALVEAIRETFDLRPRAIVERFDLLRPIYRPTAAYGHFGRDGFPWEELDHVDALKEATAQVQVA
jgi:S-adenosylmethionine synthetase